MRLLVCSLRALRNDLPKLGTDPVSALPNLNDHDLSQKGLVKVE